jgi:hypothetical protein
MGLASGAMEADQIFKEGGAKPDDVRERGKGSTT